MLEQRQLVNMKMTASHNPLSFPWGWKLNWRKLGTLQQSSALHTIHFSKLRSYLLAHLIVAHFLLWTKCCRSTHPPTLERISISTWIAGVALVSSRLGQRRGMPNRTKEEKHHHKWDFYILNLCFASITKDQSICVLSLRDCDLITPSVEYLEQIGLPCTS